MKIFKRMLFGTDIRVGVGDSFTLTHTVKDKNTTILVTYEVTADDLAGLKLPTDAELHINEAVLTDGEFEGRHAFSAMVLTNVIPVAKTPPAPAPAPVKDSPGDTVQRLDGQSAPGGKKR